MRWPRRGRWNHYASWQAADSGFQHKCSGCPGTRFATMAVAVSRSAKDDPRSNSPRLTASATGRIRSDSLTGVRIGPEVPWDFMTCWRSHPPKQFCNRPAWSDPMRFSCWFPMIKRATSFPQRQRGSRPGRDGSKWLTRTESGVCKGAMSTQPLAGRSGRNELFRGAELFGPWELGLGTILLLGLPCALASAAFQLRLSSLPGTTNGVRLQWDFCRQWFECGCSAERGDGRRNLDRASRFGPLPSSGGEMDRWSSVRTWPLFPLVKERFPRSERSKLLSANLSTPEHCSATTFFKLGEIPITPNFNVGPTEYIMKTSRRWDCPQPPRAPLLLREYGGRFRTPGQFI